MALRRAGLLVMRRGCRIEDGQSYCMLKVTTWGSQSHVDSQAFGDLID